MKSIKEYRKNKKVVVDSMLYNEAEFDRFHLNYEKINKYDEDCREWCNRIIMERKLRNNKNYRLNHRSNKITN